MSQRTDRQILSRAMILKLFSSQRLTAEIVVSSAPAAAFRRPSSRMTSMEKRSFIGQKCIQSISKKFLSTHFWKCSHFILPENIRKPYSFFRGCTMGSLTRNTLFPKLHDRYMQTILTCKKCLFMIKKVLLVK